MGSKWMLFCKRTEFRCNSTHTSGFHAAWAKNKSNFSLPATHKFHIKSGTDPVPSSKGNPSTYSSSTGSSLNSSFLRHSVNLAQQNGYKTKATLDHYKSNAEDRDLSSSVDDLLTAWWLN